VLAALLWLGCGGSPEAAGTADDAEARPVTRMQDTITVRIQPPALTGEGRFEAETVARILRTVEGTLLAVPAVVPRIPDVPLPPGISLAPTSTEQEWSVSLLVTLDHESTRLVLNTCPPRGSCDDDIISGEGSPEEMGGRAAARLLDRLEQLVPGSSAACMATPPSKDSYHSLIAGRGAAVVYGLLEADEIGHITDDPSERALLLDPKSGLANWMAARARFERGELDRAERAITKAHASCPGHLGFAADAARIALEQGKVDDALAMLEGARGAADDPRLIALWLDAWVRAGRIADAETLALRADATFTGDANVARTLAELARAQDDLDEYEQRLGEWSDRAGDDPEPARQLLRLFADQDRWTDAWRAIRELEQRGAGEEARQWKVSVGLALENYAEAASAADPVTAQRIWARAALEGKHGGKRFDLSEDDSPEADLALGEYVLSQGAEELALRHAEQALRKRPWWPEALELKQKALKALGRHEQAAVARNQWLAAEPRLEY